MRPGFLGVYCPAVNESMSTKIPDDLRAILACPKCKGELTDVDEPLGFGCASCGLFFAVVDGVPNFLVGDAIPWDAGGGGRMRGG